MADKELNIAEATALKGLIHANMKYMEDVKGSAEVPNDAGRYVS